MKIGLSLIGINRYLGGNFQYAMCMLHALKNSMNHHNLVVFYDNQALMDEPDFKFSEIKYIYINHPEDRWLMLKRLVRLLYGAGVDILRSWAQGRYAELDKHDCNVIFHPYWGTASFITNTPAVVAIHDCAPREAPEILSWYSRLKLDLLIRCIVRHARIILADSKHGRNILSTYYKVPLENIGVLPFRPSLYLSLQPAYKVREVMDKYKIQTGYLFLPGRWGSYKNTERVLAALETVVRQGFDLNLVLTGLSDDEILLAHKEIFRVGLVGRVHILGFVPDKDMAALFQGALALIFPTLLGPTSIPVCEAMALNCPVIVSNISGYPEQVGDAGLLVDPYSVENISQAIIRVAKDGCLRGKMSKKGQKKIRKLLEVDYGKTLIGLAYKAVNT
jgi:glycosyltransferase involved in cell wall biosynthesis